MAMKCATCDKAWSIASGGVISIMAGVAVTFCNPLCVAQFLVNDVGKVEKVVASVDSLDDARSFFVRHCIARHEGRESDDRCEVCIYHRERIGRLVTEVPVL